MGIDTWVGVDETVISTDSSSLIVVAAVTHNPALAKNLGWRRLKKSKDLLRDAGAYTSAGVLRVKDIPQFPSVDEMRAAGMGNFHWVKANPGRFPRAMIEHAAIAHTILQNGYNPKTTMVMIDAFYSRHDHTVRLVHRYLNHNGFDIPQSHIEVFGWGDQGVPIINYADLLAFQVGLSFNRQYSRFCRVKMELPHSEELKLDRERVTAPLGNYERSLLEQVVAEVERG